MNKKVIVSALAPFLVFLPAAAQTEFFDGTLENAMARAKAENKCVLLFFDSHY